MRLRNAVIAFDMDKDGRISQKEFLDGLLIQLSQSYPQPLLLEIFHSLDK